ncbi:MAG TPA: chemotaxis protein CheC [Acidobacteriota bacterium]|nr:chemotaxis protein CheC [Acidobacteriota bacterium]
METITQEQAAVIQQIADAGSEYASAALSQLLNKTVFLENTSIEWKPFSSQFVSDEPEKRKTILHFRFTRGGKGNIFILFTDDDAKTVIHHVMAQKQSEEFESSALKEVGNILAGAYLTAVSKITGKVFVPSIPGFFHHKWNSAIKSLLEDASLEHKKVLIMRSEFIIDNNARCQFCLIAEVELLETFLNH